MAALASFNGTTAAGSSAAAAAVANTTSASAFATKFLTTAVATIIRTATSTTATTAAAAARVAKKVATSAESAAIATNSNYNTNPALQFNSSSIAATQNETTSSLQHVATSTATAALDLDLSWYEAETEADTTIDMDSDGDENFAFIDGISDWLLDNNNSSSSDGSARYIEDTDASVANELAIGLDMALSDTNHNHSSSSSGANSLLVNLWQTLHNQTQQLANNVTSGNHGVNHNETDNNIDEFSSNWSWNVDGDRNGDETEVNPSDDYTIYPQTLDALSLNSTLITPTTSGLGLGSSSAWANSIAGNADGSASVFGFEEGAKSGGDVDIALIDSAESALEADTDYGLLGFNGGGGAGAENGISQVDGTSLGAASDLFQRSLAYNAERTLRDDHIHHQRTLNRTTHGVDAAAMSGATGEEANNGGSSFMLLFENIGDYFYNYNGSTVSGTTITTTTSSAAGTTITLTSSGFGIDTANFTNYTDFRTNCVNLTNTSSESGTGLEAVDHNYWALILILFPILTLFGNILVIMSVCRERSLQTVTNYFIVSLAIADLLVAVVVMPFAVYILFYGMWGLPNVVCDFYIAMDVICSTSSIFNLVAISIDRYIAVTQPIKYAKHKNSRRVCLTILLVWAISAAIGSPIVLGLNNTPNRDPEKCAFNNADFILYSSLSSFYIPCIIMVFLYWSIFKALRSRARKQRAARKPHLSELTGGSVIENIAQTRRLAETALDSSRHASRILPDEPATNTASGSNEEEDENAISPDIDDCHVIVNDKSTEFMLATVVEETGNVVAQITTQPQLVVADPNGNHDSGYAPSNVDDVLAGGAAVSSTTPPDSPVPSGATFQRSSVSSRRNTAEDSPKRGEPALSVAMKPLSFVRYGVQEAMTLARNDSTLSTTSKTSSRKDKKNSQASRFTIYKVHKASKKKREKSSAKKERKATKTLAIVLGVFLFCWLPFFSCNIMDAMCAKLNYDECRPSDTAYMLTTWLGYINSFVNPVIYTIFNPEFRKAFKKIMHMG